MSDGSELHRSDAATGKERRPTVVSWREVPIRSALLVLGWDTVFMRVRVTEPTRSTQLCIRGVARNFIWGGV